VKNQIINPCNFKYPIPLKITFPLIQCLVENPATNPDTSRPTYKLLQSSSFIYNNRLDYNYLSGIGRPTLKISPNSLPPLPISPYAIGNTPSD